MRVKEAQNTLLEIYQLLQANEQWDESKQQIYKLVQDIIFLKTKCNPQNFFDEELRKMADAVTQFDFSVRMRMPEGVDKQREFDHIIACLNALVEELDEKAHTIGLIDYIRQAPKDALLIITDGKGGIRYADQTILTFLNETTSSIKGYSAIELFKEKDSIQEVLNKNGKVENLNITIIKNEKARYVLDMFSSKSRLGNVEGYLYILKNKLGYDLNLRLKMAAHDLKAPINSMNTLIETLLNSHEEAGTFLNYLKEVNEKVGIATKETLEFNATNYLNQKPIVFTEVVNDILTVLRFMKGFEEVEMRVEINNHKIFYNNLAIVQSIIQNLITNAIKFRQIGKQNVISVHVNDTETGVQIIVSDTGIGMSKENKEKVLQEGFRVSNTIEGNGLGLYSIHRHIKELGGTLDVETALAIGSTFIVHLPDSTKL